jgi:translation elongation factor EF-Tu-like GTPase
MRQKLFTVEDVFNLTGRGIVVAGELEQNSPIFKVGNIVLLIHPDGKELVTEIIGIEMVNPIDYENFNRKKIGVLLKVVSKEDVPIGTEVFLNDGE